MADVDSESLPVIAVTAAVGAIVLLIVLLCGISRKKDEESDGENDGSLNNGDHSKVEKNEQKKKSKVQPRRKDTKSAFTHIWLAGSLKAHSSPVLGLDFSPSGKYIATCAEDRTVLLWTVKDIQNKDHKSFRANIEFDHATLVRFSPDSKAFIISLYSGNNLRVIKLGRKSDGTLGNFQHALDLPKGHEADIKNFGISSNGKFIMTCTADTTMKIWDLKGTLIHTIDTHQVNNSHGAVSPCGQFVASSGFTPDVKVWEVCYDKSGDFKEVVRAFELKGHTAGIHHFAFSRNSQRMATVSKDGTWKLWNINVEYKKNQDAKVLKTGQCVHSGKSLIALSPDGSTVAIACGVDISIYDSAFAKCQKIIEDIHSLPICCLQFDINGEYLVTAGDKNVHVFHNVVGFKAQLEECKETLKTATSQAHKERLQEQIKSLGELMVKFKFT